MPPRRFDEARAHGAGFYAFSKDDQKRAQEQATLKKLHEETDEARREKEKKAAKRKKEMAERIRRIKQKRREKLGLPPLEEDLQSADKNQGQCSVLLLDTFCDFQVYRYILDCTSSFFSSDLIFPLQTFLPALFLYTKTIKNHRAYYRYRITGYRTG
jgi:hypothetical protein